MACKMSRRTRRARGKPAGVGVCSATAWFVVAGALALMLVGCDRPHRVGEHVWVNWEGGRFRAFVVARMGEARYRVQFEGCDSTWQRDLLLDKIEGRVDEVEAARSPSVVACAPIGPTNRATANGRSAPYKMGDRVRVRWRGSVYAGTIAGVPSPDRFLIHYEGYENAWDEVVSLERIEGAR